MSYVINQKFVPPKIKGKSLTLIADGGIQTIGYFLDNNIFPDVVITDLAIIPNLIPYLPRETDVLLIVNNATDFTFYSLNVMVDKLVNSNGIASVTVMSNVELGDLGSAYYLYKGKPLTGVVKYVADGVKHPLFKKNKFKKGLTKEDLATKRVNPVMTPFLVFNKEKEMRKYLKQLDTITPLADTHIPLSFDLNSIIKNA
jgi:hypothetical protein